MLRFGLKFEQLYYYKQVQKAEQQQERRMFGWLNKCWGGVGVTTNFERARLICTYADWSLPDPQSVAFVISTFKGQNTEIDPQAAINSLLAHLQQDDQRKNAAFLLKNLLILDFTVQQRVFLTKIGHYYNSQLLCLETGGNQQISSSVKDLIASYYEYIRSKAKFYSTQAIELVKKDSREKYMQEATSIAMLNEINICFKIQNSILMVSDSFLNGNKSPQIIQIIFSSLLKTYLFCFSIVSLALKVFVYRIPTLSRFDLEYLAKLANYFNREYIRNFILFMQRNKVMQNFKNIKYTEFNIIDDKIINIINNKLLEMEQDITKCPEPVELPIQITQQLSVERKEEQLNNHRQSESQTRHRRKKIELLKPNSDEQEPQTNFTQYQNFYSENFIMQNDQSPNGKLSDKLPSNKKMPSSAEKKKIISKLSFSKEAGNIDLRKDILIEDLKKFDKESWQKWQNVYLA